MARLANSFPQGRASKYDAEMVFKMPIMLLNAALTILTAQTASETTCPPAFEPDDDENDDVHGPDGSNVLASR